MPTFSYISDAATSYKKGIDFQRELFKTAKHENNYDSMCDSIENIKSEIKQKVKKKGNSESIERVQKIIKWYRTKEARSVKSTPEGKQVVFPPNMIYQVNIVLTEGYEILIKELESLDLL